LNQSIHTFNGRSTRAAFLIRFLKAPDKNTDNPVCLTGETHLSLLPMRIHRIGDFSLAFSLFMCYKLYLISALNGKITSLRRQERIGHRLKADPRRVVWFAREPPWRHGRSPTVIWVSSAYPVGTNLGGTAEAASFVPNIGMKGVFLCPLSPRAVNHFHKKVKEH
jgi:hypothetical protein